MDPHRPGLLTCIYADGGDLEADEEVLRTGSGGVEEIFDPVGMATNGEVSRRADVPEVIARRVHRPPAVCLERIEDDRGHGKATRRYRLRNLFPV